MTGFMKQILEATSIRKESASKDGERVEAEELIAFKELSEILLNLSIENLRTAVGSGALLEVTL
jgi:hypothetical protein